MNSKRKISYFGAAALALPMAACAQKGDPRPNIIVILTDDMGYSDLGCYGGEILTPNIDNLAENGLRWSQFYNNARSCPSRAVLMTGLYPHQAGMGWMACADLQVPSYQGYLNRNCVTIAEVLDEADYETYMVGKWHLCSERQCWGEVKETWPVGRGFQHYYGIPEGASHYFHAKMVIDEQRQPVTGDDFYITDALSDHAAQYVTEHDYSKKPLFMYLAYNAPHWPLHALQEDIDKFVDIYKAGWDNIRETRFAKQVAMGLFDESVQLSPRDVKVPAWDTLTPEQQEEFTMRMAIYAAQVHSIDRGVGKVVEALKANGQFDNTVIMLMDDNGACAEHISSGKSKEVTGKADTYESYRINWANVSSTPYREFKHYTNEGGIASPLIVSWPKGIDSSRNGSFVREYGYFADIMATCVDLAGAKYPKKYKGNDIVPCEGYSLVPNFSGNPTGRGMTFWEHEVNIAVRDGKWKLNILHREFDPIDLSKVELYDMEKDPVELNNLAAQYPEKVDSMMAAWQKWGEKVHVFPLSTDGYGHRSDSYKRHINGNFDDNLGGWAQNTKDGAVEYSINTEKPITGAKSAQVEIKATGEKPADSSLRWNFPTEKPMTATIGFTYRTDTPNSVWFRLEQNGKPEIKPFNQKIDLVPGTNTISFDGVQLEKARYQLVFYFGKSLPGSITIDDVILDLK